MADFGDSPYKPSQDEIIYEFKYTFPKETLNRIEEIIDIFLSVVSLLSVLLLWSIAGVMKQNIIVFVLYHCACVIVFFFYLTYSFCCSSWRNTPNQQGYVYQRRTSNFPMA